MNNNTNNPNNINHNNKRRHHHSNNSNNSNYNNNSNYTNGKPRDRQRFQAEKPSINKVYDSNGPSGRQRGNASTLYERYTTLARDAHSSGDRVLSENFMQYAEHYLRIVNSIQEQMQSVYREQYSEADQTEGGFQNESHPLATEHQEHRPSNVNVTVNPHGINSESHVVAPQTDHLDNDMSRDKSMMRRKSYPYARRKPYDRTQPRYNPDGNTLNTTDSPQFEAKPQHEVAVNTQSIPNEMQTHETHVHHAESDEAVKPRRVVRRRPAVTQSNGIDSVDSKNTSLDE